MQLKRLVNDKSLWDSFCEKLQERIDHHHKLMETAVVTEEVYRSQGAIRELRRLLQLRQEINGVDQNG